MDDSTDEDVVAKAVRELVERTRFPVGFGGLFVDGEVAVTQIVGNRTRSLEGLRIRPARGLGGIALVEHRSRMTPDYGASTRITHDYDRHILGEGITTLLAVPIVVDGEPRGILYGGTWNGSTMHGVTAAPAFQIAEEVAAELRIRAEVRRRVRVRREHPHDAALSTAAREELRSTYAELRSIAASIADGELRARVQAVERRLSALSVGRAGDGAQSSDVRLSPREIDVLAGAALGRTTQQIADDLGLRAGTVKAYLGTAMSKLDAGTRHAAVARARRAGLLP